MQTLEIKDSRDTNAKDNQTLDINGSQRYMDATDAQALEMHKYQRQTDNRTCRIFLNQIIAPNQDINILHFEICYDIQLHRWQFL